jgi:hypothetical protein
MESPPRISLLRFLTKSGPLENDFSEDLTTERAENTEEGRKEKRLRPSLSNGTLKLMRRAVRNPVNFKYVMT